MTSISRNEDAFAQRTDANLIGWLLDHWEIVLYALIFVAAVFTRFYDLGARAISHDESLHMLYSYKLYAGEGYHHDPMMHGPFLFELNALLFFLFGDSNFVGRCGVALFGVILVMMPYWFRPWLGRVGAILASTFILISPAITHYSRHLRHDIFNEVFTLAMFIALFQYLLAFKRKREGERWRWLYLGAAAVALMLCTKELAFIHGFIGVTFVLIVILAEHLHAGRRRNLFWAGVILLLVVGGLILWLTVANGGTPPPDSTGGLGRQIITSLGNLFAGGATGEEGTPNNGVSTVWKLIQMIMLGVGLLFAASTVLLSVDDEPSPAAKKEDSPLFRMGEAVRSVPTQKLVGAIVIGVVIFAVLYTTFFTNPYGLISGSWGALTYWLSQHGVQRGSQPWYYYLMLLPLYEFLPLFIGGGGAIWYLARRLKRRSSAPARSGKTGHSDESALSPPAQEDQLDAYFVGFLIYWAIAALFIYSWAGEKMPWLTVHLTMPFILLAAWTVSRVVTKIDWREAWRRGGALFLVVALLTVAAFIGLISVRPFQGQSLFSLRDTGQWLGALLIAVFLVYVLVRQWLRVGRALALRLLFVLLVFILALFTFRSSWIVSFIN